MRFISRPSPCVPLYEFDTLNAPHVHQFTRIRYLNLELLQTPRPVFFPPGVIYKFLFGTC